MTKERIVCACIQYEGVKWLGKRHGDCIFIIQRFMGKEYARKACWFENQGFITNTHRFVQRREAGVIAYNAGQIAALPIDLHPKDPDLYSEDLY